MHNKINNQPRTVIMADTKATFRVSFQRPIQDNNRYRAGGNNIIQLRRGRVQIIFVDFFNMQCRAGLIFPIPDVFQVVAQGGSHHALGTCD